MRLSVRLFAATAVAACTFGAAHAGAPYTDAYVFGDSLSDVGKVFAFTGGVQPPSPPYFNGRFTNGPVWIERFGEITGVPTLPENSYAVGGALSRGLIPTVSEQVGVYLSTVSGAADPNALYAIWAGGNNYVNGVSNVTGQVTTAIGGISAALTALEAAGAKNFLVVNLPDLSKVPRGADDANPANIEAASLLHNSELSDLLDQFEIDHPAVTVLRLDVFALFENLLGAPAFYGFTNATAPCLNPGLCANPDEFVFFDDIHPSAAAHLLIGQAAANLLVTASAEGSWQLYE